ncbi:MAG: winged helix-turn-helix domain-containing protein [Euzebya sp.]
MRRLTRAQARRAVLDALGFGRQRPTGRIDTRHFRRVYDQIRVVQIDPINVLARAHHQVFMSRLGPYDRDALDQWLWRSGEVYEGWVHVDATAQSDTWPLLAHRRAHTMPWRGVRSVMEQRPEFLEQVHAEITERGELSAAQLTDTGERLGTWGTRSMGRAALDYLHHRGQLAISWRDDRMTAYFDLAQRVIPAEWHTAEIPPQEVAEKALLVRAVRAMAVGTAADVADWHRQHVPTARRQLAELASAGEIDQVEVQGWKGPVYADPGLVVPRRIDAATLINPFDPLIWNRARALRLFDHDYRIEIYVPKQQRRFGYYALPFLLGEELVALVDLKHDRQADRLRVQQLTPLGQGPPLTIDHGPLRAELEAWATWLGASTIG